MNIDYSKITDNPEVVRLLKERIQLENKIKAIDEMALVMHEIELLSLTDVGNWVAIESEEQPEIMTDVMVKYKDNRKEVAYFDGDKRFYIEKDDRDITETIIEWHKLP